MSKIRYKHPTEQMNKYAPQVEKNASVRGSLGSEDSVGEYFFLSVDDLIEYPYQARTHFSEEDISDLSETIKNIGVLTPLIVTRSNAQSGKFEIISGERRYKAAKKAGFKKVPCIIFKNESVIQEVALIDNMHRVNLHPIETGRALLSLSKKYKSLSEMARNLGKKISVIAEWVSFSKIPTEVSEYLINHNIKKRDLLRKIAKIEDVGKIKKIIGMETTAPHKSNITKSILRISLGEKGFSIQSNGIGRLTPQEKINLKSKLINIIENLH